MPIRTKAAPYDLGGTPHYAWPVPKTNAVVRAAGALVAVEGGLGVAVAVVLVIRGLLGHDQHQANGYGTAAWFVVIGGAVLAAGVGLLRGRRWGRSIAVFAQLLLLPVIWSLLTDSHRPVLGVLAGIVVVAALALLLSPPFNRWIAAQYAPHDDE
jgi:peptidoglycan/LPS O-acetylase OafA/YrhL